MRASLRKLVQGESLERERPAFKAHAYRGARLRTRAVAASCVGNVTMLQVGHVGLEDPGWLRKLPEP